MTDERHRSSLPPFCLQDTSGAAHHFPTGRPTLLCFMKQDCPTCALTTPLVAAAHVAFGDAADVWLLSQDGDGGAAFTRQHALALPALDDAALRVSYAYDLEIVPTILLTDGTGHEVRRCLGFGRDDWQALFADLARLTARAAPPVDWSVFPATRPGCGSKSVEPGIAERLTAEASGNRLRARRIDIAASDDPFEFLFDQGVTDGLPVIPPTPERVLRMLQGTHRHPQEVVAVVAPNMAPATVEKIAINAVMAGCTPGYLPVVLAAIEAVCTDEFNIHGVLATTFFPGPVLIVNGPIRKRIGMNAGMNALGQGNRANSTIGRAVQLVIRNVGGGRPGEIDRATLGQPGKYTMCFAENEERSCWPPLHVERGYSAGESTVTVYAGGAPTGFVDQLSRTARSLATSYGLALAATSHPKHPIHGEIVVIVPPEHVDTFARDGWTKDQVRDQIMAVTTRPVRDWLPDDACAEGLPPRWASALDVHAPLPKFRSRDMINLVVAGGEAGKFGAYLQGWLGGPMGSTMVTRKIDE